MTTRGLILVTRDEAVDRAIAWLRAEGGKVDDLAIVQDIFLPADHWLSTRPYDHWAIYFEPLFDDGECHPNTLGIRVDPATGRVENIGLM